MMDLSLRPLHTTRCVSFVERGEDGGHTGVDSFSFFNSSKAARMIISEIEIGEWQSDKQSANDIAEERSKQ